LTQSVDPADWDLTPTNIAAMANGSSGIARMASLIVVPPRLTWRTQPSGAALRMAYPHETDLSDA
jgi:hypothetical protein